MRKAFNPQIGIFAASFALSVVIACDLVGREINLISLDGVPSENRNRGRWSTGAYDYRIPLAGTWRVRVEGGNYERDLELPFSWDGFDGGLALYRYFPLPDSAMLFDWRIVCEGLGGSASLTVNDHQIADFASVAAFQAGLNPDHLNYGSATNRVELFLDNSRLYPGGKGIFTPLKYAGIFGDIYLVGVPKTHISDLNVRLSTGAGDNYSLLVETVISPGSPDADDKASIFLELGDSGPNAAVQKSLLTTVDLRRSDGMPKLVQQLGVASPHLYSLDKPWLYRVRATLSAGLARHQMSAIGAIRSWKTGGRGFLLNGDPLKIRGLSYIPADLSTGAILGIEQLERDVNLMKELGINVVRVVQDAAPLPLLDLCDRYGLLVFEELPVFQASDRMLSDPDFIALMQERLESMVERDRHFVCIAGWGLGGELNFPNAVNAAYYRKMRETVRSLDDRPIYASFPLTREFSAAPLDFAILEAVPYRQEPDEPLPTIVHGDRPALIGSLRWMLGDPGDIWAGISRNPLGQEQYLLSRVREAEKLPWCAGVIISDYTDWRGAIPSISSPGMGGEDTYVTGLVDSERKPRPAFLGLREYWRNGLIRDLDIGTSSNYGSGLFVIVGLIQIATLLWAIRQNKLFKINLYRSFISPRIFFQDVADRRYYQNGHTILVAALLSGGLGLVLAAWLFAHRHSYALDWLVGRMSQKPECIEWIGFLFWHPFAAILVGWILAFALLWMAVAWLNFVAFLWNRRCTMMQSLNYFTWSNVICLSLLPVGMLSEQLFELGLGWLVMLAALVLVLWSNSRLMNNLKRVYRRSFAVLATTLAAAPLTAALGALIFLEYTRNLSAYWSYFWGTIVK